MNDYGTLTEAGTVRFERLLPGPIERVWAYLTESEKRGTWLASGEMELHTGGRVELFFRHKDLSPQTAATPERFREMEEGATIHGRVTACEKPRLLAFTWNEGPRGFSEVTFTLSPRGADVLLVVTHRGLADRGMAVNVSGGWHTHLGILADALSGRVPSPFWSTYTKLEADYEGRIS
jgi:uncharacterized protein YndB with AHSA1/START domain